MSDASAATLRQWAADVDAASVPASAVEAVPLARSRVGRVYLAGPMTGIADYNFPAFNAAAARLRAEGFDVVNPADHGVVDGAEPVGISASEAAPPSREQQMLVLERDGSGKPTVWCDPEIADLVSALNLFGVPTVASCSGHGERPGNIALRDGRELIVMPNYDAARRAEALTEDEIFDAHEAAFSGHELHAESIAFARNVEAKTRAKLATPPPAPQPPNANCPIKCNSMEQCSGACDFMEAAPQPAVVEATPPLLESLYVWAKDNQGTWLFPGWDGNRVLRHLSVSAAASTQGGGK